ncbi:UvrD-helicase-domain-containing protein [Acrodontium crateriforme]|uniref:DNA 3'-5' helicase n=1 Tax=Acrodontium crateriforme TaxID=150365 RepID=A0AAQ3LYT3_9PEZI|nr:UvrD-helicase-domain-containing protein [Acrodontium crateriforme]
MDAILDGLNDAQREAVTSSASVLQVLAPPGSGKTKTLTARVAYLVGHHQLKPWNIIVCTFTVKAAREMKDRIKALIGEQVAKKLELGTFHSIALRYLKQYGQHIGISKDFGIADSSDTKAILKKSIAKIGATMQPGSAQGRISSLKCKGIDCDAFARSAKNVESQEFLQIYRSYEATLLASNLLDYDDLLLRCRFLMQSHPQCVSNVQAVLIDEFQDTNCVQYDLMRLFAQHCNAITIVGDPDQSIYGWRSAEIKNLATMKQQWPDTLTINLKDNYRSSGAILHAAQKLIEQDEGRPPKKLQATHSIGSRPVLRKLPSANAEAEWLVSEIKRTQAVTGGLLKENDFAVLLRSATLSRAIESALGKAGVPYRMLCGTRFYDRAEVKVLIDYLRVINHAGNDEVIERVINVPTRKIGDKTVAALNQEAQLKGVSLWRMILDVVQGRCRSEFKLAEPALKGLASFVDVVLTGQRKVTSLESEKSSLLALLETVIKKLNFQSYLKEKYAEDHEIRWANVEELMAQTGDFEEKENLQDMAEDALPAIDGLDQREISSDDALQLFLANVALTASLEKKADDDGESVQQITISTMHAAKGLEWPVVFIPACYDGSIPHSRAEDNDEERRLLYVGMTRAQVLLYLSCPIKNTQREETCMSTFLTQPGIECFFEEHGPMVSNASVNALAKTLRRDAPAPKTISEKRRELDQEEDNYWPLNGDMPAAEEARWDYSRDKSLPGFGTANRSLSTFGSTSMQQTDGFSTASATMKSGFVSVASKYEELMEQSAIRKIERRTETAAKVVDENPKGRKRQIDGQSSIATFFSNAAAKSERLPASPPSTLKRPGPPLPEDRPKRPLNEISNMQFSRPDQLISKSSSSMPYKPRTAPLSSRPSQVQVEDDAGSGNSYVFLSSSPEKPERNEPSVPANVQSADSSNGSEQPKIRPAATFHTTSMQRIGQPQRKTLGMRRSLHGWSARGRP